MICDWINRKRSRTVFVVTTSDWQSLMTTTTIRGDFSIVTTGTSPHVQMQLMSSSYVDVQTSVYHQYHIQHMSRFVCSFQLLMSGVADELFFYTGASAPVGCAAGCRSGNNFGGVSVGFEMYTDSLGGAGRSGPGIYLTNGAGTMVASAAFSGNGVWETVTIAYTRGTSDTWVVSWKGDIVLTYSDPDNMNWALTSGNYWGIGARSGGATGDFFLSQVGLSFTSTGK